MTRLGSGQKRFSLGKRKLWFPPAVMKHGSKPFMHTEEKKTVQLMERFKFSSSSVNSWSWCWFVHCLQQNQPPGVAASGLCFTFVSETKREEGL